MSDNRRRGPEPPPMHGGYPQRSYDHGTQRSYDHGIELFDEYQQPTAPPRSQTSGMNSGYYSAQDQHHMGYPTMTDGRDYIPAKGDPYNDVFGGGLDDEFQYDNSYDYPNLAYEGYDKNQINDSQKSGSTTSSSPAPSRPFFQDDGVRTNIGNTSFMMALLSELWLFNIIFILGGTFIMTFYVPQFYVDYEIWNASCYWKLTWIFPLPYTLICFIGLALPFRTPKFIYSDSLPRRRCDNLYILTVTKGDNKEVHFSF
jgi:hypothetical protein